MWNQDLRYNLARMPVQWVVRPQTDELHDYRGYAGRILSGSFNVNDKGYRIAVGNQFGD